MTEDVKKRCAELVDGAKKILKEAFERFKPSECAITWTGGKDSTLNLWIMRQFCAENKIQIPRVMTIDEGDAFPEITDFLVKYSKQWNIDLNWCCNWDVLRACQSHLGETIHVKDLNERNKAELKRIGFEGDSFPFEAESSNVGNHLMKTVVFNQFVENNKIKAMFMALRKDEQAARRNDKPFTEKEAGHLMPAHTRISAILDFTERELWNTIMLNKIPYCALYEIGYRSLGARTTSNPSAVGVPAWEQDLENTTERAGRRQDKEQSMERLRKLGYM
jgi:phosphoadenosine phosphosulfate reductase